MKMQAKIFIGAAIFILTFLSNASAQDRIISGEIGVTPIHLDVQGNRAKFNEYTDLRAGGVYGQIELRDDTPKYYLDFKAQDMGYYSQRYSLEGGKWGAFKYNVYFDELPHNLTYGARSFYSGIGTNRLSYPIQPPSSNVATWNTFDYTIDRKNYGAGFKLDLIKPFFVDFSVNKEERKGIFPNGAAAGSPGNGAIELPTPIDYVTDNLKLTAGYSKNPFFVSFGYFYSQFTDQNSNLYFRNPFNGATAALTDVYTLAPNNNYQKFDFKGGVKLPLKSKFDMSVSYAQAESSANLFSSYVGTTGLVPITLSGNVFNGKRETQDYSFVLTSNPLSFLDGKLFYKNYDTKNKSDQIVTQDGANTLVNPLFDYRKQKYGAELGFRLPASFYLTTNYTHVQINRRERDDIPVNKDNIYGADLRWSGLDFMLAKVGYERLERRGTFEGSTNPADFEYWIRRYDVAPKNRDTYKAGIDLFPIENLNFSFGYKYKDTNYTDTILGLQKDKRSEYYTEADYLLLKRVRLFAYFDYEYVKLDQFQRVGNANVNAAPTTAAYNWTLTQTEKNYGFGGGMNIDILPKKLALLLQANVYKSDGFADYTYLRPFVPATDGTRNQNSIDINNWGNYRTNYYIAKATYFMNQNLSFAAGYAFSKYVYDDAQYNGYQYVPGPLSSSNGAFLTGAYNNLSYRADMYFVSAAYKF